MNNKVVHITAAKWKIASSVISEIKERNWISSKIWEIVSWVQKFMSPGMTNLSLPIYKDFEATDDRLSASFELMKAWKRKYALNLTFRRNFSEFITFESKWIKIGKIYLELTSIYQDFMVSAWNPYRLSIPTKEDIESCVSYMPWKDIYEKRNNFAILLWFPEDQVLSWNIGIWTSNALKQNNKDKLDLLSTIKLRILDLIWKKEPEYEMLKLWEGIADYICMPESKLWYIVPVIRYK